MQEQQEYQQKARRVAFMMSQEEADAFLNALLSAWPSSHVSSQMTERLLRRVANAHRAFDRAAATPKARVVVAVRSARRTRPVSRRRSRTAASVAVSG